MRIQSEYHCGNSEANVRRIRSSRNNYSVQSNNTTKINGIEDAKLALMPLMLSCSSNRVFFHSSGRAVVPCPTTTPPEAYDVETPGSDTRGGETGFPDTSMPEEAVEETNFVDPSMSDINVVETGMVDADKKVDDTGTVDSSTTADNVVAEAEESGVVL
jgi:hypothetical protein